MKLIRFTPSNEADICHANGKEVAAGETFEVEDDDPYLDDLLAGGRYELVVDEKPSDEPSRRTQIAQPTGTAEQSST